MLDQNDDSAKSQLNLQCGRLGDDAQSNPASESSMLEKEESDFIISKLVASPANTRCHSCINYSTNWVNIKDLQFICTECATKLRARGVRTKNTMLDRFKISEMRKLICKKSGKNYDLHREKYPGMEIMNCFESRDPRPSRTINRDFRFEIAKSKFEVADFPVEVKSPAVKIAREELNSNKNEKRPSSYHLCEIKDDTPNKLNVEIGNGFSNGVSIGLGRVKGVSSEKAKNINPYTKKTIIRSKSIKERSKEFVSKMFGMNSNEEI